VTVEGREGSVTRRTVPDVTVETDDDQVVISFGAGDARIRPSAPSRATSETHLHGV